MFRLAQLCALIAGVIVLAGCGRDAQPGTAPPELVAPPPSTGGFHLVVEAESGTVSGTMQVAELAGSSGTAVEAPLGSGKPPKAKGAVTIPLQVPADGDAHLWFRVRWQGECSNSFTLELPGQPPREIGQDATYDTWHWVKLKGPALKLTAGELPLTLALREDGVAVDQVLVTTDAAFVPMGIHQE